MMRKQRLVFSLMLLASIAVFFGCKEEEVEKKVENTERVDALRKELLSLQKDYLATSNTLDFQKMTEEDLETQIAELRKVYDIDYAVLVTDFQGKALAGAKVVTVIDGQKSEATTNAAGLATFTGLDRGDIAGVISIEGFTTANYTARISSDDDDYSATSRVPLFPKSGSAAEGGLFTVTGKMYYDLNDNDDTLNTVTNPAGPNVSSPWTKYTQVTKADGFDITANLAIGSIPAGVDQNTSFGRVLTIAYDDATFKAIWNDDNTYSIKLPSRSVYGQDFEFNVTFEQFVKDKTLIDNGGPSKTAKTYLEKRIFNINNLTWYSETVPGTTVVRNYFYSERKN